jgi:pteridine reductase
VNPSDTRTLDGKWALVTGGARRVGARVAERLHEAGSNVVVHFRNSEEEAQSLADRLNGHRKNSAILVRGDLHETQRLPAMITEVTDKTGRLDILINNASSFYPTPLGSITEAHWNDLVGSNLKAPVFLSQAAWPFLRESRGVIINIVDIHARRPLRNHIVYGAAKSGLEMLTRSLAREMAPEVRVNAVSPGAILWPEEGMNPDLQQKIVKETPLRRSGSPDDIADCILYLVRDATFVTGQNIAVDGGRSLGW